MKGKTRRVVTRRVGTVVAHEDPRHRPRAVAVVVQRGAADAGELPEERVLRRLPVPGGLGAIGRSEAEVPGEGVVGVVLQVRPVRLGVRVEGTRLEQDHVEPLGGELFRHDGTAAARTHHDHVNGHSSPPDVAPCPSLARLRLAPEIPLELVPSLHRSVVRRQGEVARQRPADRCRGQRARGGVEGAELAEGPEGRELQERAGQKFNQAGDRVARPVR